MARQQLLTHCEISLQPLPPFRLDLTVWALRRRPDNAIDRWDGATYRRAFAHRNQPFEVAVTQTEPPDRPRLDIVVTGNQMPIEELRLLATRALERVLGLRKDLSGFYQFSQHDQKLSQLVNRFMGVKPPRFPTVFEGVVNGIACQQISLSLGIKLLNRLAGNYGLNMPTTDGSAYSFATAEKLAGLDPEDLRHLGLTYQKGRAITEIARSIVSGQLDLEGLADLDDQTAVERLMGLRGVGRWTAQYVLLRGLGRTDVFPGDDVGARNNLTRWLGLSEPLNYQGVLRVIQRYEPYGGMVYFHLLLNSLAKAGYFPSDGD